MTTRRTLLIGALSGAGLLTLGGCRGVNPDRLGVSADGFADVDQTPVVDAGPVGVGVEQVAAHDLAYLAPGQEAVDIRAGEHGGRVIILGGTPFGEQIVMWWNFIGRDHDEVVASRDLWQARVEQDADTPFGRFDYPGDPLPAPPLPGVRLRPRG